MIRRILLAFAVPPFLFNQFLSPFYLIFFSLSRIRSLSEVTKLFWVILITTIIGFTIQFILNINNPLFSQYSHFLSLISFLLPIGILIFKIELSIDEILHAVLYGSLIYSFFFFITLFLIEQPPLACIGCVKQLNFIGFPQRFTSILVLASAIAITNLFKIGSFRYAAYFLLLLVPIVFSYTRSIWIEFLLTFFAISTFYFFSLSVKKKLILFLCLSSVISFFFLLWRVFPDSLLALTVASLAISSYESLISIFDPQAGTIFLYPNSEGQRLYFWGLAIDIFFHNPMLGTGLAGLYQFGNPEYGSIHSQWIDQLMRTGLIGLCIYIYCYLKIIFHYFQKYPEVVSWILGLAVFGLFNESTKILSVAMIFFILLNKAIYKEV